MYVYVLFFMSKLRFASYLINEYVMLCYVVCSTVIGRLSVSICRLYAEVVWTNDDGQPVVDRDQQHIVIASPICALY